MKITKNNKQVKFKELFSEGFDLDSIVINWTRRRDNHMKDYYSSRMLDCLKFARPIVNRYYYDLEEKHLEFVFKLLAKHDLVFDLETTFWDYCQDVYPNLTETDKHFYLAKNKYSLYTELGAFMILWTRSVSVELKSA